MITLTDSELCALQRITELALPAFVVESDADDVRVDAAALRGMAVRELVSFDDHEGGDGEIGLSPALRRHLAPCTSASVMAEVDVESAGEIARTAIVADDAGNTTVFAARGWGLVGVERDTRPVADVVSQLCGLEHLGASGGLAFSVSTSRYQRVDDLCAAGEAVAAVDRLIRAGVSLAAAEAWIDAVTNRTAAVLASVAREENGSFVAGELCWVVGHDGTAWLVTADDDDNDDEDGLTTPMTTARQVDAATLIGALAEVVA